MSGGGRNWAIAAIAAVAGLLLFAVWPGLAQELPAYQAPRLAGTQTPDLNGIWQVLTSANWDLQPHPAAPAPIPQLLGAIGAEPAGQGVVEGGVIPYQPWALAKKKANFAARLNRPSDLESNQSTGDPEAKCYLPGVPRATYIGLPFQIIQTATQILLSYEFASATRIVYLDRTPKIPADAWMGWSVGHWEGDTLVIDVTHQLDSTWLDRAGDFHSDALHVVERYTPLSPYHLRYEATLDDPKIFTRPWKISMPLYRRIEKNSQLLEFKCVEFTEQFMYGRLLDDVKPK